jgi:hypothetical protein
MKRRCARRQPPLKGGRDPLFSCVLPEIRAAAVAVAQQHDVSPSWVVATILAKALGVADQPDFKTGKK